MLAAFGFCSCSKREWPISSKTAAAGAELAACDDLRRSFARHVGACSRRLLGHRRVRVRKVPRGAGEDAPLRFGFNQVVT